MTEMNDIRMDEDKQEPLAKFPGRQTHSLTQTRLSNEMFNTRSHTLGESIECDVGDQVCGSKWSTN